ncbi:hypothetical protein [Streptomyces sp. NPDC091268]|uniref:hypothetical protein n=1 Tax=Streptomyces sp. NPDC091268 TaxID=3365979 RepID=UPI0037F231F1
MPRRRLTALPLILPLALALAGLVATAGCVTVHPPSPPGPRDPAAAGTAAAREQPAVPGRPLGPLPSAGATTGATAPAPAPPAAPPPAPPGPARGHGGGAAHRDGRAPRAAKPAAPAPVRRRERPPARPGPRSVPHRTYDMAQLCAASRGVVSPAITALCR